MVLVAGVPEQREGEGAPALLRQRPRLRRSLDLRQGNQRKNLTLT